MKVAYLKHWSLAKPLIVCLILGIHHNKVTLMAIILVLLQIGKYKNVVDMEKGWMNFLKYPIPLKM